jgi:hypothetical protein
MLGPDEGSRVMAEDDAPRNDSPRTEPPTTGDAPAGNTPGGSTPGSTPGGEPLAETAEHAPLDHTAQQPPVDQTAVQPPRWSARAHVPARDLDDDGVPDWQEVEEAERRGLVVPALIALCILLLAALIGLGVWLALRDRGSEPVTPPSPTAPATTTTTTPPTSTTAATTEPVNVEIPVLRGSSFEAAQAILAASGFGAERVDEPSTEVPEDQVINTDPPAGTLVRQGTVVRVFVSSGPPSEPTTPAPTTTN